MTMVYPSVIEANRVCLNDGWRYRKKHSSMLRLNGFFPSKRHRRIHASRPPAGLTIYQQHAST